MEERRQGQGSKGLVLGDGAEARPCRTRSGGGVEGRHGQGGELDLSVVVNSSGRTTVLELAKSQTPLQVAGTLLLLGESARCPHTEVRGDRGLIV